MFSTVEKVVTVIASYFHSPRFSEIFQSLFQHCSTFTAFQVMLNNQARAFQRKESWSVYQALFATGFHNPGSGCFLSPGIYKTRGSQEVGEGLSSNQSTISQSAACPMYFESDWHWHMHQECHCDWSMVKSRIPKLVRGLAGSRFWFVVLLVSFYWFRWRQFGTNAMGPNHMDGNKWCQRPIARSISCFHWQWYSNATPFVAVLFTLQLRPLLISPVYL